MPPILDTQSYDPTITLATVQEGYEAATSYAGQGNTTNLPYGSYTTGPISIGLDPIYTSMTQGSATIPSYQGYQYVYPQTVQLPTAYTIYEITYCLKPNTKPLTQVFTHPTALIAELAIMEAADRQSLRFIELLGIKEVGAANILLTTSQKIKELIL